MKINNIWTEIMKYDSTSSSLIKPLALSSGGTGQTTLADVQNAFGIKNEGRVTKTFSLESGHLTGTIYYFLKSGVVIVYGTVNRVAGGSINNGWRGTGITMPANMRPANPYGTVSCMLCPTNNTPSACPQVAIGVTYTGEVRVWYGATMAPSTGYTWSYEGLYAFPPAM